MNAHIKKETPDPDQVSQQSTTKNDYLSWPPVSDRTRSKTAQFYNQQRCNTKDIFGFGKALEKQSLFSMGHMKK